MKFVNKNNLRLLVKVALFALVSVPCSIVGTYAFFSLWGINAHYLPTLFTSFFETFCPSQTSELLEMPTRHEVLQEMVHIRENALWTLDLCLRGWSVDSHREMIDPAYFLAIARRVNICFSFATLTTFSQWLEIVFEHLQPISPIWSNWYTVNAGYLYGADDLAYRAYIRQGLWTFGKFLLKAEEPLTYDESDKLIEVLLYIAVTLSKAAQNPELDNLLQNIDDPWMM